jgi:hypothetical protein
MAIKYIMLKDKGIVMFSGLLNHNEVAQAFREKPLSAGFVSFDGSGGVNCYGESISLGIKSREEDGEIAQRQLYEY